MYVVESPFHISILQEIIKMLSNNLRKKRTFTKHQLYWSSILRKFQMIHELKFCKKFLAEKNRIVFMHFSISEVIIVNYSGFTLIKQLLNYGRVIRMSPNHILQNIHLIKGRGL